MNETAPRQTTVMARSYEAHGYVTQTPPKREQRTIADNSDDGDGTDERSRMLNRIIEVWSLDSNEVAMIFGVSEAVIDTWRRNGVPAKRSRTLEHLHESTDRLVHNLKPDRIKDVVRRPIPAEGGDTLIDLARKDTEALLHRCEEMFQYENMYA